MGIAGPCALERGEGRGKEARCRVVAHKHLNHDDNRLSDGGTVVFSLDGGKVKLTSIHQTIKRAQDLYSQQATRDFTVDDFIAERRAEPTRNDKA